jgi:hypothetical protein
MAAAIGDRDAIVAGIRGLAVQDAVTQNPAAIPESQRSWGGCHRRFHDGRLTIGGRFLTETTRPSGAKARGETKRFIAAL